MFSNLFDQLKEKLEKYSSAEYISKHRAKYIKAAALFVVFVVALTVFVCREADEHVIVHTEEQSLASETELVEGYDNKGTKSVEEIIFVDVGGAVVSPTVVQIPVNSRIFQAITAVGGFTDDADVTEINLAAKLQDGDKLYIPTIAESLEHEKANLRNGTKKYVSGAINSSTGLININKASTEQLDTLPGIGPELAGRIIEYRTANGNFETIESLVNVRGIGDKTLARFKDKICI